MSHRREFRTFVWLAILPALVACEGSGALDDGNSDSDADSGPSIELDVDVELCARSQFQIDPRVALDRSVRLVVPAQEGRHLVESIVPDELEGEPGEASTVPMDWTALDAMGMPVMSSGLANLFAVIGTDVHFSDQEDGYVSIVINQPLDEGVAELRLGFESVESDLNSGLKLSGSSYIYARLMPGQSGQFGSLSQAIPMFECRVTSPTTIEEIQTANGSRATIRRSLEGVDPLMLFTWSSVTAIDLELEISGISGAASCDAIGYSPYGGDEALYSAACRLDEPSGDGTCTIVFQGVAADLPPPPPGHEPVVVGFGCDGTELWADEIVGVSLSPA